MTYIDGRYLVARNALDYYHGEARILPMGFMDLCQFCGSLCHFFDCCFWILSYGIYQPISCLLILIKLGDFWSPFLQVDGLPDRDSYCHGNILGRDLGGRCCYLFIYGSVRWEHTLDNRILFLHSLSHLWAHLLFMPLHTWNFHITVTQLFIPMCNLWWVAAFFVSFFPLISWFWFLNSCRHVIYIFYRYCLVSFKYNQILLVNFVRTCVELGIFTLIGEIKGKIIFSNGL